MELSQNPLQKSVDGSLRASSINTRNTILESLEVERLGQPLSDNEWPAWNCRIFAAISSLNSVNVGYDLGINTGLAVSFQRTEGDVLFMTTVQLQIYMAAISFTSIFGALFMKLVSERYGRRGVFLASQIVLFTGLAINIITNEFSVMLIGRFICGLGIGLAFSIDSVYISEIAPKRYRGQLVSWAETGINIGIVLGFVVSYAFQSVDGNAQWKAMIGLGLIMPCILFVLVLTVLPESPRWLLMKGRPDDAVLVLDKCSHPFEDGAVLAERLQQEIDEEISASADVTWQSLWTVPVNRKKMKAGLGVACAGSLTGIDGVQYYMLSIFAGAGMPQQEQFQALLFVGMFKLLVVSVGGYAFDKVGRKPALISSLSGIAVSLFVMGATHHNRIDAPPHTAVVLAFVAVLLYMGFFSLGMGPGAWLLPSELYSNDIRSHAISVTVFCNRLIATIIALTFLSLEDFMGFGVYLFFGFINIISTLYIFSQVPETSGISLEKIHELFLEN